MQLVCQKVRSVRSLRQNGSCIHRFHSFHFTDGLNERQQQGVLCGQITNGCSGHSIGKINIRLATWKDQCLHVVAFVYSAHKALSEGAVL